MPNRPIGFDQDPEMPEGVGTVHFEDGSSVYAEAPDIAAQLSSAQVPDMRTAQAAPSPQGAPVAADAGGSPFMQWNDEIQQAPAAPRQGGGVSGSWDEAPPPEAPPPSDYEIAIANATAPVRVPGSPGVDPYRMRREGVPVPTKATETTEAGAPYSLEMAEMRQAAHDRVERAKLAQVDMETARAEAQAAQARAAIPELEYEAHKKERALNKLEWDYKEKRGRLQGEIDSWDSRSPDPNRFFKEVGTFGTILLTISQAIASAAGNKNGWAEQFINRGIENDIKAQEKEIQAGRISANNRLNYFREMYDGDLEQAKTALRLAQKSIVDKEILAQAAATGREDTLLKAQEWIAQNQQARMKEEQDFYTASLGKTTRVVASDVVQPRRATGGGWRKPTREEIANRMRTEESIAKSGRVISGEPTPEEMAKIRSQERIADRSNRVELGKGLAQDAAMVRAFDDLLGETGLRFDQERGKVIDSGEDLPGVGLFDSKVPGLLSGEKARAVRQKLRNAVDLTLRDRTGAAARDEEIESTTDMILGSGTEKEFRDGLEMLRRMQEAKRDQLRSTYGVDAVEDIDRSRGELQRKRRSEKESDKMERY